MQERNLLKLFVALNAALAGGFVIYLFITQSSQPKVEAVPFATTKTTNVAILSTNSSAKATNGATSSNLIAIAGAHAPATNAPAPKPAFSNRRFTWQDVESPAYQSYLESLRAVGCPEERVRSIVVADIEDLFASRRLKEAVSNDLEWWKANSRVLFLGDPTSVKLAEAGRTLDNARIDLITKLLGPEAAEKEKDLPAFWSQVPLSGPVLGKLSREKHAAVQDICGRSIERSSPLRQVQWVAINGEQPQMPNAIELAKMREQTRSEIRQVLTPEEQEEFLLRYSQVSHDLASELNGFNFTADEFRRIFRAVDPIDHALHLEFGSVAALSPQQRERHEQRRNDAIRGALSPERYQAFMLTKDPLYRQAQTLAMQWQAPSEAVFPLYDLAKTNETRRQKIITDAGLQQQQRNAAIQALAVERQKITADAALDQQQKTSALQELTSRQQKLMAEAAQNQQQINAALQSLAVQQQQETMRIVGEIRAAQLKATQRAN